MRKISKTVSVLVLPAIALLLLPAASFKGAAAHAAEIKVLSANVFTGVLEGLFGEFERQSGHKVSFIYGTAGAIKTRVQAGEFGDVTILPRPMLDQLLAQGRIAPGSIVDLARSTVAVAVRSGAPKPDVSTVDAFKRSLSAAKSITYPDPAGGGATGVLVAQIFERLGLTTDMKPKTRFPPPGQFGAAVLARGEAELAIAQPMEVLTQPGTELAGLLPAELQEPLNFTFSMSIMSAARERQAGQALIQFLAGPEVAAALKAKGMEPG
jgi:molybdate transport system substrate-binding protein